MPSFLRVFMIPCFFSNLNFRVSKELRDIEKMAPGISRLKPGQRIGEYVVEKQIGEGSFGRVYKVSHFLTGKKFALKLETTDRNLLQLEHRLCEDVHKISPGGRATELLNTQLLTFGNGVHGLLMDLKGPTIR